MSLTPKPTVQLVDVTKLRPWERNPRTITVERFDALKRSLALEPDHLRARPLIAIPDGRTIAGNMRQRAAHALVEEGNAAFLLAFPGGKVPTFVVDLDEQRAAAWALRDNNEYGEWQQQELAEILYELEQAGADVDLTGFTQDRVTQLIDTVAGPDRPHNFPDDPAPEPPKRPKTKAGQIFDLGPHRLMCGDATNPEAVARLLDGAAPKLMVTDPPYGVNLDLAWRADAITDANRAKGKASSGRRKGRAGYDTKTIGADVRVDWAEAYALVPSLKVAYVWFADKFVDEVGAGLKAIGFTPVQLIIWDKLQFALSRSYYHWQHETALYVARLAELGKSSDVPWYGDSHVPGIFAKRNGERVPWLGTPDQSTVWQAPSPKRRKATVESGEEPVDHPTQKPTLLYTRPYQNHTRRGDAVYEPFGGSGTALIAAEMTSRRAFLMELDPAFCDVIRTRYAEYTGEPKWAP